MATEGGPITAELVVTPGAVPVDVNVQLGAYCQPLVGADAVPGDGQVNVKMGSAAAGTADPVVSVTVPVTLFPVTAMVGDVPAPAPAAIVGCAPKTQYCVPETYPPDPVQTYCVGGAVVISVTMAVTLPLAAALIVAGVIAASVEFWLEIWLTSLYHSGVK